MSRARLGLYVFCRRFLFEQCYELQPTFQLLLKRPDRLALNLNETTSYTERLVEHTGPIHLVSGIEEMSSIIEGLYQVCLIYHCSRFSLLVCSCGKDNFIRTRGK